MRIPIIAAALLVLGLTTAAYWPGLSGGFLFDDFANLRSLGAYGPVDDWRTLLLYLTSGIADPTGRPVSVASFLLDARDWPADPWPFKRTNLLLHLSNGLLLAAALFRLESWLGRHGRGVPAPRRGWIALLGASLWLAHPLWVSTTLYIVQRHAMLPLTFLLAAVLCWDRACARFADGRAAAGWCWGIFGMLPAFVLAGLAKANGLLAPLLVLTTSAIVIRPAFEATAPQLRRTFRRASLLLLVLPTLLVLAAFWQRVPPSLDFAGLRRFTLGERLLTEPRVLFDYLAQLLAPRAGGGGVFVEGYQKSTGLLEPWSTLPAIALLGVLLLLAWRWRRRAPELALAVLFFFAAHLMESSAIMLELYFEHRNYLPAVLLFWPLARWIVAGRLLPAVRPWLGLALPALLLALTWQRAVVWGDPALLAALSAHDQPASVRANVVSAAELGKAAGAQRAAGDLREALRVHGPRTALVFNLVAQECGSGRLSRGTIEAARTVVAAERRWHSNTIDWLRSALHAAASGACAGLDLALMDELLAIAERNPAASSGLTRRQNLSHLRAVHSLLAGRHALALEQFDRSLALRPNPDAALTQAALLGRAGQPALGLRHLDYFERLPEPPRPWPRNMQALHRHILLRSGYHEAEIAHLRRALAEAAAERATGVTPTPPTEPE